jgi:hypothetical protein
MLRGSVDAPSPGSAGCAGRTGRRPPSRKDGRGGLLEQCDPSRSKPPPSRTRHERKPGRLVRERRDNPQQLTDLALQPSPRLEKEDGKGNRHQEEDSHARQRNPPQPIPGSGLAGAVVFALLGGNCLLVIVISSGSGIGEGERRPGQVAAHEEHPEQNGSSVVTHGCSSTALRPLNSVRGASTCGTSDTTPKRSRPPSGRERPRPATGSTTARWRQLSPVSCKLRCPRLRQRPTAPSLPSRPGRPTTGGFVAICSCCTS